VTKEARVKRLRIIMVALVVILAALAFAAAARPQALIVDTAGQTLGDGSHTVAPIDVAQENGDTTAAVSAGHGTGSAAQAAARNGDDSVTATVGCIDAAASSGDLAGSASLRNCDGASAVGSGGGAGLDNGAVGGGLDLSCLTAALDGPTSLGAQLGACEGAAGDGGDDTDEPDDGGGVAGDEAGGVLGEQAGGQFDESGSGDGQGGEEPCGTFDQMAGLAGPGSLPLWLFGLVALGGFGLGTFRARRRSSGMNEAG
jgi:hypothetical protein